MGEYASWKEFADAAGIAAPQLSEFKNASVEPLGLNLLKLIQATTARRKDISSAAGSLRFAPPDRLEELVTVVNRLEELMESSLTAVESRLARIDERLQLPVLKGNEGGSPG